MIILLYGSNKYLLQKKLREIVDRYQQKHQGLSLCRFDAEQSDFQSFWQDFQQKSMFVQHRLTIIENIFQGEEFKKQFKKQLKCLAEDDQIIVAWEADRPKSADRAFVERIKKYGQAQEFPQPKKTETKKWLIEMSRQHQLDLSAEIIDGLAEQIKGDWFQGQEAVSRLAASGNQLETMKELEHMAGEIEAIDVFRLTAAISRGVKDKALSLTHLYFSQGGRPEKLLALIVFQFRQLLIVRDLIERGADYYQVRRSSGLPSFVVWRLYGQAEELTMERLRDIYRQLFELDRQLKTGQVDSRTGFDLFIAKV